jgi:hypothetical protein
MYNAVLGSWVPDERGPTFASFYPDAAQREGLAVKRLLGTMLRARWAARSVFGEKCSVVRGRRKPRKAGRAIRDIERLQELKAS